MQGDTLVLMHWYKMLWEKCHILWYKFELMYTIMFYYYGIILIICDLVNWHLCHLYMYVINALRDPCFLVKKVFVSVWIRLLNTVCHQCVWQRGLRRQPLKWKVDDSNPAGYTYFYLDFFSRLSSSSKLI